MAPINTVNEIARQMNTSLSRNKTANNTLFASPANSNVNTTNAHTNTRDTANSESNNTLPRT